MPQRKSVLLCGIKTHVCVLQRLDRLDNGCNVHGVSDIVSSSTSYNRSMALERMRQSGAYITSSRPSPSWQTTSAVPSFVVLVVRN
ncbi:hypothetical protein PInf_022759 [Phytophthora infestans]|nr:hypothetical protein PInf_022759 [Phytophthora infestans]